MKGHWAFEPIDTKSLKQLNESARTTTQNAIDIIVRRDFGETQPQAATRSRRITLLRRLSFDLTGIGPTPAEIEQFMRDQSPNAYERQVDRLLASPRYGERMAADWLDLARYADSYGFQVDRERDMWPWRDWVISSFNQNMPWDKFITWQLAGDLLPRDRGTLPIDAIDEQLLATAF